MVFLPPIEDMQGFRLNLVTDLIEGGALDCSGAVPVPAPSEELLLSLFASAPVGSEWSLSPLICEEPLMSRDGTAALKVNNSFPKRRAQHVRHAMLRDPRRDAGSYNGSSE